MLHIIDTGIAYPQENMDKDKKFLESLGNENHPILHFYEWKGASATFGHFINPGKYINLEKAEQVHLRLGRRPTGGGIVFHIWDFAFSFLMPSTHKNFSANTLANYRFVNEAVLQSVQEIFPLRDAMLIPENLPFKTPACQNFCMAGPTQYDVVHQGLKIAGAAQRRKQQGYLHQGTISLAFPQIDFLRTVLHGEQALFDAMAQCPFAPLGNAPSASLLANTRLLLRKTLAQKLLAKIQGNPV